MCRSRCDDCARQDQSDPLNRLICAVDKARMWKQIRHVLWVGLVVGVFVTLLIEIAILRHAL